MPFGIDPKQIEQVVNDISTMKMNQAIMLENLAAIQKAIATLNDHNAQITHITLLQDPGTQIPEVQAQMQPKQNT